MGVSEQAALKFFMDDDFDVQANIESALGEISFSGIEIPAELQGTGKGFGESSRDLDATVATSRTFASVNPRKLNTLGDSFLNDLNLSTQVGDIGKDLEVTGQMNESVCLPPFSAANDSFLKGLDRLSFDGPMVRRTLGKKPVSGTAARRRLPDLEHTVYDLGRDIDEVVKTIPEKLVGSLQFEDFTLPADRVRSALNKPALNKPALKAPPPTSAKAVALPGTLCGCPGPCLDCVDGQGLSSLKACLERIRKADVPKPAAIAERHDQDVLATETIIEKLSELIVCGGWLGCHFDCFFRPCSSKTW